VTRPLGIEAGFIHDDNKGQNDLIPKRRKPIPNRALLVIAIAIPIYNLVGKALASPANQIAVGGGTQANAGRLHGHG
jgi:hypothetical protein